MATSSASQETVHAWDRPEYRRIVSAHVDQGVLYVLFADGTYAGVETARLVRPEDRGVRWGETQANPHDVTVPMEGEPMEISWLTLRALSDPAFDAYLVRRGAEQARRVGERLRTLRQARRLESREVA